MTHTSYDIIGDIHGQAGKLEALLAKLGYEASGRGYRAPAGRQAIFLGDLIDRGPAQLRVLEVARAMIDAGAARSIMGNHEFNAIGFATDDPAHPGEAYRPNRVDLAKARKNRAQHAAFLAQVGEGSAQHREWVQWFRTLPPFLELDGIRAVHGSWDDRSVAALKAAGWVDGRALDDALLAQAYDAEGPTDGAVDGSAVGAARKRLTCGLELDLPAGRVIHDKSGAEHHEVRVADWRNWAKEFKEVALVPEGNEQVLNGMSWPQGLKLHAVQGAPVFIGHHWFNGTPKVECKKLACLDYSAGKGGPLVAYRWDGEQELVNEKLAWVEE